MKYLKKKNAFAVFIIIIIKEIISFGFNLIPSSYEQIAYNQQFESWMKHTGSENKSNSINISQSIPTTGDFELNYYADDAVFVEPK